VSSIKRKGKGGISPSFFISIATVISCPVSNKLVSVNSCRYFLPGQQQISEEIKPPLFPVRFPCPLSLSDKKHTCGNAQKLKKPICG
jgi:hypothetical protein